MKINNIEQLNQRSYDAKANCNQQVDSRYRIMVCAGTGCTSSESLEVLAKLEQLLEEKNLTTKVTIHKTGCFGLCQKGPIIAIQPDHIFYNHVSVDNVEEIIEGHIINGKIVEKWVLHDVDEKTKEIIFDLKKVKFYAKQHRIALRNCGEINPEILDEYLAIDGYQALAHALTNLTSQEVIDIVKDSKLRGRGGGGFPAGVKWQFAHDQNSVDKYVICNADEGDPGAFMDRSIIEGDPHAIIEAMALVGYAIGAKTGYVYVRAEYPIAVKRFEIALDAAHEAGLLGKNILDKGFDFDIEIRLGAGAFVCGEETALIKSIEGKRGMAVAKPPFPAVMGVWGKPTIINNVETLANVPQIVLKGSEWFKSVGTEKSPGTKIFALGGKIVNTGLVEVPMGTTLRDVIFEIGGGIPDGKQFKAIQTGGPSGGCLTKDHLDTEIDFDSLIALGSMMGSGGMICLDETSCMVDFARFYMEFIVEESCGKCTPCRIGTKRLLELLEKICAGEGTLETLDELEELSKVVQTGSLCGLGQSAPNPVVSTLRLFRDEYVEHVTEHKCRAGVCKELLSYRIIEDKCKKCSLCERSCPVNAISGVVGKEPYVIDSELCIKCGACVSTCKFGAIVRG